MSARLMMALLGLSVADGAHASERDGFAVSDLTEVAPHAIEVGGRALEGRAEPQRMTLACFECADFTAVDILVEKSNDGTEGRFRSGETLVSDIEAQCRRVDAECQIERVDLAGAVGWVSRTKSFGSALSTTILFKDGDRLVIRSVASDLQAAFDTGKKVRETYGLAIIAGQ